MDIERLFDHQLVARLSSGNVSQDVEGGRGDHERPFPALRTLSQLTQELILRPEGRSDGLDDDGSVVLGDPPFHVERAVEYVLNECRHHAEPLLLEDDA